MISRPDMLLFLRRKESPHLALVPELPSRKGEMPSEMEAFSVERNLDTLNYLTKNKLDLLSLQRYDRNVRVLQDEWKKRWSGVFRKWSEVCQKVEAQQEGLASEYEHRTGLRKTSHGTLTPLSLYFFGEEILTYKTPQEGDPLPQPDQNEKIEFADFITRLADVSKLLQREFALAYAPSLAYTKGLAGMGLTEKRTTLLQEWVQNDAVRAYQLDSDSHQEFYATVQKKSAALPVKRLQSLPYNLNNIDATLLASAHAFVSSKLFHASEKDMKDILAGVFRKGEERSFIQHDGSEPTSKMGYKLHVRGEYIPGQNIYRVLPLVYEYCSRNKLSFKIRVYDGRSQFRAFGFARSESRWGETLITIYPDGEVPQQDNQLQPFYDAQLDTMLTHARHLETLLSPYPNESVRAPKSDEDLHLGKDASRRLSIRFGENSKNEQAVKTLSRRLNATISDREASTFADAFPKALSLDDALRKIHAKQ